MDIVFLINQLTRGGAETQLVRIAVSLRARGWRVGILSLFSGNDFEEELCAAGVPVLVCEPGRLVRDYRGLPLRLSWRLVRALRGWKPRTLVTFGYHADVLGRICGRLAGVPSVIGSLRTAHAKSPLREKIYRFTEPLVDLTISNSRAGVSYMVSRRALTLRKTRVIPNGMFTADYPSPAPREEVRAELGMAPGDFLWIAVGTLNPAKDYPTLLDAAARCAAASSAFRLRIAGGGDALEAMRADAAARGLGGSVAFLGKRADVPRLLKAADAFVLSSAWEGMPNAVMEALASGLPVVATEVGGVPELIEPGETGWIVPPGDSNALAEGMLAAMALDGPSRARIGSAGREAMAARFDHARIADLWEDELSRFASPASAPRPKDPPAFVISLDFELLWGMRDKQSIATYGDRILGEREAVPAMLRLFAQYGVKATWAAVGMALFDNRKDLLAHLPDTRPAYARPELDPYAVLGEIGDDERSDPYHYGLSLIRQVLDCEGMELGSHTFSHYYCLERGQTARQFRADMEASVASIARLAAPPTSLVFPRNQYNPAYLPICAETGFEAFRGNEQAWMYQGMADEERSTLGRGARAADNYVSLTGHNGFTPFEEGGLINCPSSRFLRPFHRRLAPLEGLRLRRINGAMDAAARAGQSFHLWWHPHNFGSDLKENLETLEGILRAHVALRDRYGVVPMTMKELAERTRASRSPSARPGKATAAGA